MYATVHVLKRDGIMLDKEQTIKKLYMAAADVLEAQYNRQFIMDLQLELNNPEFVKAHKLSDWRTYIINDISENWHFIDELGRLLFWLSAMDRVEASFLEARSEQAEK